MRIKIIAIAAITWVSASIGAPAMAQDMNYTATTLSGNWGGARQRLHDNGVDLSADYVGEFAHNLSGGNRKASAYADQIHIGAAFDFAKLLGWGGASLHIDLNDRNGPQLDQKAGLGTLLETQEIYGAGHGTRLTRFYYEQQLWSDLIDVKLGRMDISDSFFPFSCNFQNLNFCGSLPGYNTQGWYNWPVAQTGGVLRINPGRSWYIKIGIFQANKNNLLQARGLAFTPTGKNQGVLSLFELGWKTSLAGNNDLPGSWAVGGWHNSGNYPNVAFDSNEQPIALSGGAAKLENSVSGTYAMGQQKVLDNAAGGGLSIFGNFMKGDPKTDLVDEKISLGLLYEAPFASRPHDRIGFAIGRDHVSELIDVAARQFNYANQLSGFALGPPVATPGYEYVTELNYKAQIIPGAYLMPDIQYIHHPGGARSKADATVLGLRVALTF